jgi:CRP/FNR family transcriptional regulator
MFVQASVSRVSPHPCRDCDVAEPYSLCPDSLRTVFDSLKTSSAYGRGDAIFHEGDPSQCAFIVCEGTVKLITSSAEGKVLLLRYAGPGEVLGIADIVQRSPYSCTAVAAERAVLGSIPSETFLRFVRSYPEAGVRLTQVLSAQYKAAQRETRFLAFGGTSVARLAHLLLEWAAEHGVPDAKGIRIPSHATQTELAQAIGATRETVTRVLGQLIRSGVLERTPDSILIHNAEELTRLLQS